MLCVEENTFKCVAKFFVFVTRNYAFAKIFTLNVRQNV